MSTPKYSDAAKVYADKHCWFAMHARGGPCAMAEGFDAGAAHRSAELLAFADDVCICVDYTDEDCPIHGRRPALAPVLLTADDPRIKAGARVQFEFTVRPGDEGSLVTSTVGAWIGMYGDGMAEVYLLAEAPDPDADVVANLVCELVEIDDSREWTITEARRLLAVARADS